MKKRIIFLVVLVSISAAVSFASYDQSVWQTIDSYTYQEWSFDSVDVSNIVLQTDGSYSYVEVADYYDNQFEAAHNFAPTMTITNINSYAWEDIVDTHQGVWGLARNEYRDLVIDIPNDKENTGEGSYKEMRVEIVYRVNLDLLTYPDGDAYFAILGTYDVDTTVASNISLGDDWYVITYDILIEPNPGWEQLQIVPEACTTYIDSIVVETICIPEPATMALIAAGLVMLRRK